jgi:hypothetical protein
MKGIFRMGMREAGIREVGGYSQEIRREGRLSGRRPCQAGIISI